VTRGKRPRISISLHRRNTLALFGLLSILSACGDGTGASEVPSDGEPLVLESITLGSRHTCGLTPAGKAYCWGSNERANWGTVPPPTAPPRWLLQVI